MLIIRPLVKFEWSVGDLDSVDVIAVVSVCESLQHFRWVFEYLLLRMSPWCFVRGWRRAAESSFIPRLSPLIYVQRYIKIICDPYLIVESVEEHLNLGSLGVFHRLSVWILEEHYSRIFQLHFFKPIAEFMDSIFYHITQDMQNSSSWLDVLHKSEFWVLLLISQLIIWNLLTNMINSIEKYSK